MGIKHPDPKLPEMKKCLDAIKLSKELGLYGSKVFFNEWTPYEMRQTMLLESDAGTFNTSGKDRDRVLLPDKSTGLYMGRTSGHNYRRVTQ